MIAMVFLILTRVLSASQLGKPGRSFLVPNYGVL